MLDRYQCHSCFGPYRASKFLPLSRACPRRDGCVCLASGSERGLSGGLLRVMTCISFWGLATTNTPFEAYTRRMRLPKGRFLVISRKTHCGHIIGNQRMNKRRHFSLSRAKICVLEILFSLYPQATARSHKLHFNCARVWWWGNYLELESTGFAVLKIQWMVSMVAKTLPPRAVHG